MKKPQLESFYKDSNGYIKIPMGIENLSIKIPMGIENLSIKIPIP